MKIGLVALGGAHWMGGANYVRHLGAAIRAASPETELVYVCGSPLLADWKRDQPRIDVPEPSRLARFFGAKTPLRQRLADEQIDFLYPLTYDNQCNLRVPFPLTPQLGTRGWAGWIPDFQHRHLPELFSPAEIEHRETRIAQLVVEAPKIVFSSETAAGDFCTFYPEQASKAEVLTFATPPIDLPLEHTEAPPRFLLVCNQFWKHKNHLVILDALRLLRARGVRPLVLCTGELGDYRDNSYSATIRAALAADGLHEQVQLLGLIPRARQVALLRQTIAIIQPSHFEGWSSVVEDARVLGRPCLLSDLAVHREQHPPGARFFDPHAPEQLADLIAEAWAHWPAGPDSAAEALARAQAEKRLVEVGHRVLEIAAACRA